MLRITSETPDGQRCLIADLPPGEITAVTKTVGGAVVALVTKCLEDDTGAVFCMVDPAAHPELGSGLLAVEALTDNPTKTLIPLNCGCKFWDGEEGLVLNHIPTLLN